MWIITDSACAQRWYPRSTRPRALRTIVWKPRSVLLSILASYCRDLPSSAVLSRVIIFDPVSSRVAEAAEILLGHSCRTWPRSFGRPHESSGTTRTSEALRTTTPSPKTITSRSRCGGRSPSCLVFVTVCCSFRLIWFLLLFQLHSAFVCYSVITMVLSKEFEG